MFIGTLIKYVAYGAAIATGCKLVEKGHTVLKNPYRKAKLKGGLKEIKEAFTGHNN